MARNRTISLLPPIFQTPANKQFLDATLDQMVQEPKYAKTEGYVGRKVGPGVQYNDYYVTEPTTDRVNYQLEPGVVSLVNGTNTIEDVITYPGINDAITVQGGYSNNPDRLYKSEYYTFDPFVDFDMLANYSEYYWLPAGPPAVSIYATDIPLNKTYNVTRKEGYYTFSGITGRNPSITLARGGTYSFNVAQVSTTTTNLLVGNNGSNAYVIDYVSNPTLTFVRGNTYVFNFTLVDGAYPLYIKTEPTLGTTNVYSDGVFNNGTSIGSLRFTVPVDAPDVLYYTCSTNTNMSGAINVVDPVNPVGPRFCIQSEPGLSGTLSYAPNISSYNVVEVINNGADYGTVVFKVPAKTEQAYYYTLTNGGDVDLVSDINYTQLQNVPVTTFLANYPNGIDDITNLDGRTIIFTDNSMPAAVYLANYVSVGGVDTIQLALVSTPADDTQFFVLFGTKWSQTQWYTHSAQWLQVPLLTAIQDKIYYQDNTNPDAFGVFEIVDQDNTPVIDVNDILSRSTYESPNGVTFTNGLKVTFSSTTYPASYQGNTYIVEGVGSQIKLIDINLLISPEVPDIVTEIYEPYDTLPYGTSGYDGSKTIITSADPNANYLTISRASQDLNPWTRTNRWFHKDVITASYIYNNLSPVIDESARAKRPILQYRAGLKLFNFGTCGIEAVNLIDFGQTNAFVNVEGAHNYSYDGYTLQDGDRIIFPNDQDPLVRNNVYKVSLITPLQSGPPTFAQPVINLTLVYTPVVNNTTVCRSGDTERGEEFMFDGVTWTPTQQKTHTNQPPLFDLFDSNSISFGDKTVYPSSTFTGSKLFGYQLGTSEPDSVLGFAIVYENLTNIGSILFQNYLYTDTFNYQVGTTGVSMQTSEGFAREYSNCTDYELRIGWQTAVTTSIVRQQFQFIYDGNPIVLDVAVTNDVTVPPMQIFVNDQYVEPALYSYDVSDNTTTVILTKASDGSCVCGVYKIGDVIEIDAISDQISKTAFYTVPMNLENNPLNQNSDAFTLGTIRTHFASICSNLYYLTGAINGANNTRDLGNIVPYGLQILQQSAPMTLAGYFMRSESHDIFQALAYNSREYIKFKSKLLDYAITHDVTNLTAEQILDQAITEMGLGRTVESPFYWSDMLPWGSNYTSTTHVVTPYTGVTYNTVQTYTYTSANYLGLIVQLTTTVSNVVTTTTLIRGKDYTVSTDAPQVTMLVPLQNGDVIEFREFADTYGSFAPNTPSKMGLYPKYLPEMYLDTDYVNPTFVIRGHDGSITVAFGDIRDEVLLEYEKRVYSNIKVDGNPIPLLQDEVISGFFRHTAYTRAETVSILADDFLSWVGWNKVDYKTQDFISTNTFTYNYSTAGAKLTDNVPNNLVETPLPGAWRGIYQYFYDTLTPNTRPWELLGFSERPEWWDARYSTVPYTSGNLLLWTDLANGYIADPEGPYINPLYVRPGLTYVIPSGTEGELLSPLDSVVGQYNPVDFQKSWIVGDGGPTEASWWLSSSYPFAAMRLLALTRPAQFFSLFADRDLYRYQTSVNQYLYNGRYRLNANDIQVYGNGVSKASYINWIVDYNRQLGIDTTSTLTTDLHNLDVRLCYRMAGYTSKDYTQVVIQSSSPNSTNVGLQLPPQNYQLLLYKNEPFAEVVYSAVTIQVAQNGGYTIYGYNNINPYFEILASLSGGAQKTVSAGDLVVSVPAQYSTQVVQVPYGYTFANTAMVVDFLLSYGQFLQANGLTFTSIQNGLTMNWDQMAAEFLYFAAQGWSTGTIMNVNPSALVFTASRPYAVVDTIDSIVPENMVLDQNRQKVATRDLVIYRDGNSFSVTSATGNAISFLRLRYVSYENLMVIDNTTMFGDVIYDTTTNARQTRVYLSTWLTTEWDGTPTAQGFIFNTNDIADWHPNTKYPTGQIVKYKNKYWQALDIVEPSEKFDFSQWIQSQYTKVQQGLLPNIPNMADELANSYDVHLGALNPDMNLMAFGLIGFNPRDYMTQLDLDEVSQVNVYQQFIGSKGTTRAAELFTNLRINKQITQYDIYENWAIQYGRYGGNADRSFIEIQLNEALLTSNPSTVQVISSNEQSTAEQTVNYQQLWSQSSVIRSHNVFPVLDAPNALNTLPWAGYADLEDVDVTVFSLDDPTSINADINSIGIGTVIWAAKANAYDWGIYRCEAIGGAVTKISDNLNSTSMVTFDNPHGLVVSDLFIIRFVSSTVDGVYRVLATPSNTQVIIALKFIATNQTSITTTGIALKMVSCRVAQASDIANLDFANALIPGERVWCDNNGLGQWEVLEKTQSFTEVSNLIQPDPITNSLFGTSVAQSAKNVSALVGAPAENTVFTFVENTATGDYLPSASIAAPGADLHEFGYAIASGSNEWSVAGAPGSYLNTGAAIVMRQQWPRRCVPSQLLVGADVSGRFGQAVAVSWDQNWLIVGAPVANKVQLYGLVHVDNNELVTYVADGTTSTFDYITSLLVTPGVADQLIVEVNRVVLYPSQFSVTSTDVVLPTAPAAGSTVRISRRLSTILDTFQYFNVTGTASGGRTAVFNVFIMRGVCEAIVVNGGTGFTPGTTLNIPGTAIGGASPANDLTITVSTVIPTSGMILTCSTAGTGITTTTVFNVKQWLYPVTDIESFSVVVNGEFYVPGVDYVYNVTTGDMTLTKFTATGAEIVVSAGSYYRYAATLAPSTVTAGMQFGYSVTSTTEACQIIVGAPNDLNSSLRNGSSYAFNRQNVRYQVTNTAQLTYAYTATPISNPVVQVFVNGVQLTDATLNKNGQYTLSGLTIVLQDVTLQIGDNIEIAINEVQLIQQLTLPYQFDDAKFGYAVDMCTDNDELYIGAPWDGINIIQGGSATRFINQSRMYGATTSLTANPVLTPGDIIRINDLAVAVPAAGTVASLIDAINDAHVPNVVARATMNLNYTGNGVQTVFNTGTLYATGGNPFVTVSTAVAVPGVDYVYANNQITFTVAPLNGAQIVIYGGRMVISVINPLGGFLPYADGKSLLTVLPGTGTVFDDLGFNTFVSVQSIYPPVVAEYSKFGSSISIDTSTVNLVIGAIGANAYEPTIWDGGTTYFDSHSTTFFDLIPNSGVAYTYDYLPPAAGSVANPGMFVFGQQIWDNQLKTGDQFGAAVSYVGGKLLIGAPLADFYGVTNSGSVRVFNNPTDTPSWMTIRIQEPAVDVRKIDTVYSFNKALNNYQQYYDYIDPLQGKILGVAERNIDFISAVDPAFYNVGPIHNNGNVWGGEHEGEIWWDTNNVRFIDPSQDDIVYAARKWGAIFPGSTVDVYQWVGSDVPPLEYAGQGTPLSTLTYSVVTSLSQQNVVTTTYYFWVRGLTTVASWAAKTLSPVAIASYIADPRSSGIPYVAFLSPSAVALYNAPDISAQDTILHLGYKHTLNPAPIHEQYQLIQAGNPESFLNDISYIKFVDSLCGFDAAGNSVPDLKLPIGDRYGVEFTPRQSMFVNRFAALENYIGFTNRVLLQYPIVETKFFPLLYSTDPEPSATDGATVNWNAKVQTIDELYWQDLSKVPNGYLYLVETDSTKQGYWTIYRVVKNGTDATFQLVRVQTYNVPSYWAYTDWYEPTYNTVQKVVVTVPAYVDLQSLSLSVAPIGSTVRVAANNKGKWELFVRKDITTWTRVALQDGTIQFSKSVWDYPYGHFGYDAEVYDSFFYDQDPSIETRFIIDAINTELFIDDMARYRNQALVLMFEFIYSEFETTEWLTKTSFIDVEHVINKLNQSQTFQPDNQDFVIDYLNEVKPYHCVVKNFSLIYTGEDDYPGYVTDFDCPAFWDLAVEPAQFVSPILLPYTQSGSTIESLTSDTDANAQIWLETPWSDWYSNYTLQLESVLIISSGAGYTSAPTVTVVGACATQATIEALVNSSGLIISLTVTNPGAGYLTTPTITITGGGGSGGLAYPVMGNKLVRSFDITLKYDRCEYRSTVTTWRPDVRYPADSLVRYLDQVWTNAAVSQSSQFDFDQWVRVAASALSGVDRTMGYYVPGVNQPGLSLPLLVDGVIYPGVGVAGQPFNSVGFGYSTEPYSWGNIPGDFGSYDFSYSIGPIGDIDVAYSSSYLDMFLGQGPADIVVDGGAYVDTYSSHAPQELVPGQVFDTLNLTVISTTEDPFHIFQDMRGAQAVYLIPPGSTTTLAQPLSATETNTMYVTNAANLPVPDFANNQWGVVMIDGERIMYRQIDTVANTISSMLRGTAGTAADAHLAGAEVISMSSAQLAPMAEQNYIDSKNFMGDGIQKTFSWYYNFLTTSYDEFPYDWTTYDETQDPVWFKAIQVYVGGCYNEYPYTLLNNDPITIEFAEPPPEGVEVTILIQKGTWWLNP